MRSLLMLCLAGCTVSTVEVELQTPCALAVDQISITLDDAAGARTQTLVHELQLPGVIRVVYPKNTTPKRIEVSLSIGGEVIGWAVRDMPTPTGVARIVIPIEVPACLRETDIDPGPEPDLGSEPLDLGTEPPDLAPGPDLAYPAGAVGHWPFNESGGTTAMDVSGFGNDGTLFGAPPRVDGKLGSALDFAETGKYVSVPDRAALNPTAAVTISAWVTLDKIDWPWQAVLIKTSSGAWGDGFGLFMVTPFNQPSQLCAYVNDCYTKRACTSNFPVTATYRHVAMTYDRTNLRLFVDGAQVASLALTGPITQGALPLGIGAQGNNGLFGWDGKIDEVRLYDRALSVAEIEYLAAHP